MIRPEVEPALEAQNESAKSPNGSEGLYACNKTSAGSQNAALAKTVRWGGEEDLLCCRRATDQRWRVLKPPRITCTTYGGCNDCPLTHQESAGAFRWSGQGGFPAEKAQNAPVSLQMASRGNAGLSCACTKPAGCDWATLGWCIGPRAPEPLPNGVTGAAFGSLRLRFSIRDRFL